MARRTNRTGGENTGGRGQGAADALKSMLASARAKLTRLQPRDAYAAVEHGAVLIDTRPEFQRRADGEIPGAVVIERNHLEWRLHPASDARIPEAVDEQVQWIVLCDEGFSSSLAAASLQSIGLTRATDVIGGFKAWHAAGLPVSEPGTVTSPRLANGQTRQGVGGGTE